MYDAVAVPARGGPSACPRRRSSALGLGELLAALAARAPRRARDALLDRARAARAATWPTSPGPLFELLPAGPARQLGPAGVPGRAVPPRAAAPTASTRLRARAATWSRSTSTAARRWPSASRAATATCRSRKAVQASTALPGLYRPVRIGGRDYVDGGVKKTAHINLAIQHGADLVICVNPIVPIRNDTLRRAARAATSAARASPTCSTRCCASCCTAACSTAWSATRREHPEVDILLLEPTRDDLRMFSYNIMRYSARQIVAEHGYRSVVQAFRARERRLRAAAAPPRHRACAARARCPPLPRSVPTARRVARALVRLAGHALLGARAQGGLSSASMTSAAAVSVPPAAPAPRPRPAASCGRSVDRARPGAPRAGRRAVYWRWSRARAAAGGRRGAPARPDRARHRAARRPGRAPHPGRVAPRPHARAGLRHRAGPPLADGPPAPARAGRAGGGLRRRRRCAVDREIRTLGLGDAARRALPRCRPTCATALEAYAAGVNAYIETHGDALPLEFRLLRYAPRPLGGRGQPRRRASCSPSTSPQGWEERGLRAPPRTTGCPRTCRRCSSPRCSPTTASWSADDAPAPSGERERPRRDRRAAATTGWSPARTPRPACPLLANDPAPGPRRALDLDRRPPHRARHGRGGRGPARHARASPSAATAASPGAARTSHDDSADLYVEELRSRATPTAIAPRRGWERVHGPPRARSACATGALSSSWRTVDHAVRSPATDRWWRSAARQYALRWTALEDDAAELTAFARLQRARQLGRVPRRGARSSPGPSQNFVYADVDGHIALVLRRPPAHPPRRRRRAALRRAPSADGDWLGFVPFDELPAPRRPALRPHRHREQPPRRHRLPVQGDARRHRALARGRALRAPWRRARAGRPTTSRACRASGSPSRIATWRGRLLRGGGAPPRRRGLGRRGARAGGLGRPHGGRTAAPPRWPRSPSARSATRVILPAPRGACPWAVRSRAGRPPSTRLILERPAAWVPAADADWDGVLLAGLARRGSGDHGEARPRPLALDAGAR